MALHLIGLGLHDPKGISVRGLERARSCPTVYAEFYTATMAGGQAALEAFLSRKVTVLDRLGLERGGERLVAEAGRADVAILVAGDPLAATTHADLIVRARAAGVAVVVTHAASIFTAAPGLLGLQHYKMGRATTLVRPEANWSPTSPFDAVRENREHGLHTLVLLDIKSDLGYFMTANEGLALLADLAQRTGASWFDADAQVGVVARAGSDDVLAVTGTLRVLRAMEFGAPLHCLVVPGQMQVVEQEAWDSLRVPGLG